MWTLQPSRTIRTGVCSPCSTANVVTTGILSSHGRRARLRRWILTGRLLKEEKPDFIEEVSSGKYEYVLERFRQQWTKPLVGLPSRFVIPTVSSYQLFHHRSEVYQIIPQFQCPLYLSFPPQMRRTAHVRHFCVKRIREYDMSASV